MQEFTVNFSPQGKSVKVAKGTDLLSAAIRCGIVLSAACGGEGLCGKCRVIIKKGKSRVEPSRLVSEAERKAGTALACQSVVEGDLEVEIPAESLGMHERPPDESEEFTKGVMSEREKRFAFAPLVRKIHLNLPKPTRDDGTSDLDRICTELESRIDHVHLSTKLANIKHLDELMRESGYDVTVVLGHKDGSLEILSVEPGDTSSACFGFAFDIGTTTVAGQLIDLNTGKILGTRIAFNRQAAFGSDIITRIVCAETPDGLAKLNEAVIENIDEIIEEMASSCGANLSDIYGVTFAGNMTMMHLLLSIDPSSIRRAPYVPATTVFPVMPAPELELEINPKGIASFLPGVASYIGGDIVAGVVACGLAEAESLTLLADIGTNGEIVLGNREWMMGAAASAGPAFEGSGLGHGMKAVNGAIEKVAIDERLGLKIETIGGAKPKGICGSGYIDVLCQLLKRNIIGKDGKINRQIKSDRVRKGKSCYEFVIAFGGETAIGKDIVIDEDDIENLKRAKGAIYSAIIALLNKVERKPSDLKKVYIAGGFGSYLNIENAVYIGLLPDIDRGVYEFIGNSSLTGARMALLSQAAADNANDIYKRIMYLDLGSEPDYMDEYIASLFFPHTDLRRFPSVRL